MQALCYVTGKQIFHRRPIHSTCLCISNPVPRCRRLRKASIEQQLVFTEKSRIRSPLLHCRVHIILKPIYIFSQMNSHHILPPHFLRQMLRATYKLLPDVHFVTKNLKIMYFKFCLNLTEKQYPIYFISRTETEICKHKNPVSLVGKAAHILFPPLTILSGDIKMCSNNKASCQLLTYYSLQTTWTMNVFFHLTEHRIKCKGRCMLTLLIVFSSLSVDYFLSSCARYPSGRTDGYRFQTQKFCSLLLSWIQICIIHRQLRQHSQFTENSRPTANSRHVMCYVYVNYL
jgi:hypothetical protein